MIRRKYPELSESIRRMLKEQNIRRDEMLPSERELARRMDTTQVTVRKALQLLEKEQLIYKIPGKGSFAGRKPASLRRSRAIAVLIPETDIFFFKILCELEKHFSLQGYHPLLFISDFSIKKEREALDFIQERGVDALAAVPNEACARYYENIAFPVVFFDSFPADSRWSHVISDDYAGACRMTEHLIGLGCRRIAHIGGAGERTSELRAKGFIDTMEKYLLEVPDGFLRRREHSRQWGFYAARELFSGTVKPDAVFCGNDTLAAGARRYFTLNNIRVPQDCALGGFGNTSIAEDLDISSVSQDTPSIAAAVWKNLQSLLNDREAEKETIVSGNLVVRGSTNMVQHNPA